MGMSQGKQGKCSNIPPTPAVKQPAVLRAPRNTGKVNGEELGCSRTNHILERWGRMTGWSTGVLRLRTVIL